MTDGLFSSNGFAAPLAKYDQVIPTRGWMLVDDSHGAGVLGKGGRGTLALEGVSYGRIIQCVTFSKALGTYGGAILSNAKFRNQLIERSRAFAAHTPPPLPLVNGTIAALKLLAAKPALNNRLNRHAAYLKEVLSATPAFQGNLSLQTPGPIVAYMPASSHRAAKLRKKLLAVGIFPPFLHYPGGPPAGYFRFVISSEHTLGQIKKLIGILTALPPSVAAAE
jgi:7-keto-8-aminopelargonate synthetase-like enzyme